MNDMELLRGQRPATLLPTRAEKQHNQTVQAIVYEAKENALRGDAAAAIAGRSMERTVDLYKYGQTLAGGDPKLEAVMNSFVADFVASAQSRGREFNAGFRL